MRGVALGGIAPAAAAARMDHQHITGRELHANLFCPQRTHAARLGMEHIVVRLTVRAAAKSARAVAHAVARRVADRALGGLDGELQLRAGATAILTGAARVRPQLMTDEVQREAHLGDLDAAELDAAD